MSKSKPTPSPKVTLSVSHGVGVVTMTDQAHRNVLSPTMVEQLCGAIDAAESDDSVRCIVLASDGPAFCAGAELSVLESSARGDFAGIENVYRGFLRVLEAELPTIAVINGPAVGAGLNLALACDLRVATPDARFDSRFQQLRLIPGGGHTWMLERAVGRETAAAMTVFGERLTAHQAESVGLVWQICDTQPSALATAIELGARLASAGPGFARTLARVARAAPTLTTHGAALDLERYAQRWSTTQPEFLDGVQRMRAAVEGTSH
jgi:enoyl-CoA hydratase